MRTWSPNNLNFFRLIIFSLTMTMATLPLVPASSMAATTQLPTVTKVETKSDAAAIHSDEKKQAVSEETTEPDAADSESTEDEGMSTTTKVVIGVGAAVAIGAALALGGGGGGSSSPDPILPPTVEQLLGDWGASATSNEHTSYTGTYTLYVDGTHSYDLQFSEGYRKVGRGRWKIDGYRLTLYNDTGSIYSGEFTPGNIVTITLSTNGGWTLHLTNM